MKISASNTHRHRLSRTDGILRDDILRGAAERVEFNDVCSEAILRALVIGQVDDRNALNDIDDVQDPNNTTALLRWWAGRSLNWLPGPQLTARERVGT